MLLTPPLRTRGADWLQKIGLKRFRHIQREDVACGDKNMFAMWAGRSAEHANLQTEALGVLRVRTQFDPIGHMVWSRSLSVSCASCRFGPSQDNTSPLPDFRSPCRCLRIYVRWCRSLPSRRSPKAYMVFAEWTATLTTRVRRDIRACTTCPAWRTVFLENTPPGITPALGSGRSSAVMSQANLMRHVLVTVRPKNSILQPPGAKLEGINIRDRGAVQEGFPN